MRHFVSMLAVTLVALAPNLASAQDAEDVVWIKDGNQWKQVHRHASPLIAGDTP